MNHRVLELLKTPKNIQSEDLTLLKEEINSFPYVQNIRALYLYGVHLYDKENYQGVLSTTAAYTTDKKILYQLINGKIQQPQKPEIKQEIAKEKPIPTENPLKILYQNKAGSFPIKREEAPVSEPETTEEPKTENAAKQPYEEPRILPPPREEIKQIYVNGERNRILFEGEENFLNDDTVETIDLESTLESGSIVTQKIEKKEEPAMVSEESRQEENTSSQTAEELAVEEPEQTAAESGNTVQESEAGSEADFHEIKDILDELEDHSEQTDTPETIAAESESSEENQTEKSEEFTPEIIIQEENINAETEKEKVLDESEVSFHETEAFMPEVKLAIDEAEEVNDSETPADESTNSDLNKSKEVAGFTPEKVINEDEISSEKIEQAVQDESELSFHGTESFLPEVKIQANEQETINKIPEQNLSKHEDEMRRLIEEVERKMKEKAASEENKKEEPEDTGHEISFAETQHFEVKPAEPETPETKETEESESEPADEQTAGSEEEAKVQTSEQPLETPSEEQPETRVWKPMSLDSNTPDSLLNKPAETSQPVPVVPKEEVVEEDIQNEKPVDDEIVAEAEENSGSDDTIIESRQETAEQTTDESETASPKKDGEERVMNVSFFGSDWKIPQPEKTEVQKETSDTEKEKPTEDSIEKAAETPKINPFDSNVPGFINTWQSWLKIDRTPEVEKEKTELKNKVIETFIENNPRISQLKEESSFVVREKGDDISHLMTETLANLYFEQKLYTKAIKAFEILIRKTPEKKKYYEGKIQQIKDFRTKGN